MPSPRLLLASASPRRRQLLAEAGYRFEVLPADIDESDVASDLPPVRIAEVLADRKSALIAAKHPADITLGADTVVALGRLTLGKAVDADDARRILRLLSGTHHEVITAVRVRSPARGIDERAVVTSSVYMRELTDDELESYVASGQWKGKAGAYGIQDNDPFVTRVDGSHTNIVGLPMEATTALLARAGATPNPAAFRTGK